MSVEHGGHHEDESLTSIIAALFLVFVLIPIVTAPAEEAVQGIVIGEIGGHGH